MAGFNLGRIIGEKGEKGEMGPKGDTGAKGERGEKGDNGKDGLTPIFSVGKVETLLPGEDASVEIDVANPASPLLNFGIPAGKDGKDSLGDMIKAVYDKKGVNTDVYEYAEKLFEKCLEKTGGNMAGSLIAAEAPLTERAVRNISVGVKLPQSGANGDICIITKDTSEKKLGECQEGNAVILKENGKDCTYIIVGLNRHAENSVTLVREELCGQKAYYDYGNRGEYFMSDIDSYLESIHISVFPDKIRNSLLSVEVEGGCYRHCFLLSQSDFANMSYFNTKNNRIAKINGSDTAGEYMTSTCSSMKKITTITATGDFSIVDTYEKKMFRPAIVLPSEFPVENTSASSRPTMKLPDAEKGIYVFLDGVWKECSGV